MFYFYVFNFVIILYNVISFKIFSHFSMLKFIPSESIGFASLTIKETVCTLDRYIKTTQHAREAYVNQTHVRYRCTLPFVRYFAFDRIARRTIVTNASVYKAIACIPLIKVIVFFLRTVFTKMLGETWILQSRIEFKSRFILFYGFYLYIIFISQIINIKRNARFPLKAPRAIIC